MDLGATNVKRVIAGAVVTGADRGCSSRAPGAARKLGASPPKGWLDANSRGGELFRDAEGPDALQADRRRRQWATMELDATTTTPDPRAQRRSPASLPRPN